MRLMPKQFRYTLTYQGNDVELYYAPRGWDDETLGNYSRSKEYFGLIRSFSLPLRFVKDGAEILRTAFINDGIQAGVRIKIERRRNLWDYETIYIGDLDFSTYEYDGLEVSVQLMDSGISSDIKARENTTFEFNLTGSDVVNVVLPGVKFDDRLLWIMLPTDTSDLNVAKKYIPPIDLITQSRSGYLQGFNVQQRNAADTDGFGNDIFIRCDRSGGVSCKLKFTVKGYYFKAPLATDRFLYLLLRTTRDNSTVYTIAVDDTANLPLGITNFERNFEIDYDFTEGEALYIYSRTDVTESAHFLVVSEGEIEANFNSQADPSNCKAINSFDMFRRIMNRISPGTPVNSTLLTSTWKNLMFTTGTAIREIENPKIKISLKQFFQTMKSIDDSGIGSDNGTLRLEKSDFFARNVEIMNIGNVNSCTTMPAEEYMANLIKVGYKSRNTDENDGRQGFAAEQQFTTPLTRVDSELDYVADVIADQFEIERLRVNFNVKREATSDSSGDNDVFLVHCNPINIDGNYYPIKGSDLEAVTGLTAPLDAYNLLISPKRNLLRHSGYLRSILDRLDGRFIEFASAEKNADLSTTFNGEVVLERQSVNVSSLNGKYFRPYVFNINAKLPRNAMRLMDTNPFGYITFNFNGNVCSGYILEGTVDLAGNAAQEWKLLCGVNSILP